MSNRPRLPVLINLPVCYVFPVPCRSGVGGADRCAEQAGCNATLGNPAGFFFLDSPPGQDAGTGMARYKFFRRGPESRHSLVSRDVGGCVSKQNQIPGPRKCPCTYKSKGMACPGPVADCRYQKNIPTSNIQPVRYGSGHVVDPFTVVERVVMTATGLQSAAIGITVSSPCVALVFVLLRLYTRCFVKRNVAWEDGLIVAAMILSIGFSGATVMGT